MTLTRVNSNSITDGSIVDADVNASAAIAGTKVSPDFGSQNRTSTGTSTAASFIPSSSTVPANGVFLPGANALGLATNSTERVRVTSAGLVGIGTTSPGAPLHVVAGTNARGIRISAVQNNSAAYLTFNDDLQNETAFIGNETRTGTAGQLVFGASGSERARIDSSGRLLVGTSSSPSSGDGQYARLVVSGNTTGDAAFVSFQRNEAATAITSGERIVRVNFGDSSGNSFAAIDCEADANAGSGDYPGRLVFSTTADGASSPTERMRITQSGYFKASNTGSYNDVTGSYHEIAGSNAAATLFIRNTASSATRVLFVRTPNAAESGTDEFLFVGGTVNDRVYIFNNGNIKNTNNSYGAISDIKLKENIVDASSQWDDIKSLQVRKYNFKEGQTHTQIGLVAQEVELVSPGLVSESPDRDADGNDLGTVTKAVNYSVLYMKAVKALQEAMERIEQLEANNADLLARVTTLESA